MCCRWVAPGGRSISVMLLFCSSRARGWRNNSFCLMSRKGVWRKANWVVRGSAAPLTFSIAFPGKRWQTIWRAFRRSWIMGKVIVSTDRQWWGIGCAVRWLTLVTLGPIFLADVQVPKWSFQQRKEEKMAHDQMQFPKCGSWRQCFSSPDRMYLLLMKKEAVQLGC